MVVEVVHKFLCLWKVYSKAFYDAVSRETPEGVIGLTTTPQPQAVENLNHNQTLRDGTCRMSCDRNDMFAGSLQPTGALDDSDIIVLELLHKVLYSV